LIDGFDLGQDLMELLAVLNFAFQELSLLLGFPDRLSRHIGCFRLTYDFVGNRLGSNNVFLQYLGILHPRTDIILGLVIYRADLGLANMLDADMYVCISAEPYLEFRLGLGQCAKSRLQIDLGDWRQRRRLVGKSPIQGEGDDGIAESLCVGGRCHGWGVGGGGLSRRLPAFGLGRRLDAGVFAVGCN
jgi:hypothetical protein